MAVGVPDLPVRLLRTSEFAFSAQLADRYRAGEVFLAGDAAHRLDCGSAATAWTVGRQRHSACHRVALS